MHVYSGKELFKVTVIYKNSEHVFFHSIFKIFFICVVINDKYSNCYLRIAPGQEMVGPPADLDSVCQRFPYHIRQNRVLVCKP